jgi:hypothetical protein
LSLLDVAFDLEASDENVLCAVLTKVCAKSLVLLFDKKLSLAI